MKRSWFRYANNASTSREGKLGRRKRDYWYINLTGARVQGSKLGDIVSARDNIIWAWDGKIGNGGPILTPVWCYRRKECTRQGEGEEIAWSRWWVFFVEVVVLQYDKSLISSVTQWSAPFHLFKFSILIGRPVNLLIDYLQYNREAAFLIHNTDDSRRYPEIWCLTVLRAAWQTLLESQLSCPDPESWTVPY